MSVVGVRGLNCNMCAKSKSGGCKWHRNGALKQYRSNNFKKYKVIDL